MAVISSRIPTFFTSLSSSALLWITSFCYWTFKSRSRNSIKWFHIFSTSYPCSQIDDSPLVTGYHPAVGIFFSIHRHCIIFIWFCVISLMLSSMSVKLLMLPSMPVKLLTKDSADPSSKLFVNRSGIWHQEFTLKWMYIQFWVVTRKLL